MIIVPTVIRLIVFGLTELKDNPNAIRFLGLVNSVERQSIKARSTQASSIRTSSMRVSG
jgi:hypothetical protein